MQRGWFIVVMACMLLISFAASSEAAMKIGVVDFQKAMEISSEGQTAKAIFQKEVEKVQRDLKIKQDELNKLKEEIEVQGAMLNAEARLEKQRQYETRLRDFKRLYEDYQEEMRREDAQLSEKILRKLIAVIEVY
ncbi:MAG: OmpH family outer membrane protein, partial [bacterium]|nr:OmpH family outer membrane protein [bacterium]